MGSRWGQDSPIDPWEETLPVRDWTAAPPPTAADERQGARCGSAEDGARSASRPLCAVVDVLVQALRGCAQALLGGVLKPPRLVTTALCCRR
jgi:hypothetical protein